MRTAQGRQGTSCRRSLVSVVRRISNAYWAVRPARQKVGATEMQVPRLPLCQAQIEVY